MRTLESERRKQGYSLRGLQAASGVNKTTINQIERGRFLPSEYQLAKLASALRWEGELSGLLGDVS
ncbi:MAG: helix-turn-helix domain-containing protein [Coriobacteriales bacterium]|nr:helix-turn-helix domain-containing protein [Coriobacteriales bacterium]